MRIQLNPTLPVVTPKGPALAHFLIDEGIEHDLKWVCFQDNTGECWTWRNRDIRAQKNITQGRDYISPFYDPDDVAFSKMEDDFGREKISDEIRTTEGDSDSDDLCDSKNDSGLEPWLEERMQMQHKIDTKDFELETLKSTKAELERRLRLQLEEICSLQDTMESMARGDQKYSLNEKLVKQLLDTNKKLGDHAMKMQKELDELRGKNPEQKKHSCSSGEYTCHHLGGVLTLTRQEFGKDSEHILSNFCPFCGYTDGRKDR